MKILYIDDDGEDCDIFHEAVCSISPTIKFDLAKSCEEALFKLKSQKLPDIIFVDINMPVQTGKDFLKIIKTNPLLRPIPVIAYSTSNTLLDMKDCLDLGAAEYRVKQNDFESMCNDLRSCIKNSIRH